MGFFSAVKKFFGGSTEENSATQAAPQEAPVVAPEPVVEAVPAPAGAVPAAAESAPATTAEAAPEEDAAEAAAVEDEAVQAVPATAASPAVDVLPDAESPAVADEARAVDAAPAGDEEAVSAQEETVVPDTGAGMAGGLLSEPEPVQAETTETAGDGGEAPESGAADVAAPVEAEEALSSDGSAVVAVPASSAAVSDQAPADVPLAEEEDLPAAVGTAGEAAPAPETEESSDRGAASPDREAEEPAAEEAEAAPEDIRPAEGPAASLPDAADDRTEAAESAPAEAPRRGFWQRLFGSDDSAAQPEAPAGEPAGTPAADGDVAVAAGEAPEAPVTESADAAPVPDATAGAEALPAEAALTEEAPVAGEELMSEADAALSVTEDADAAAEEAVAADEDTAVAPDTSVDGEDGTEASRADMAAASTAPCEVCDTTEDEAGPVPASAEAAELSPRREDTADSAPETEDSAAAPAEAPEETAPVAGDLSAGHEGVAAPETEAPAPAAAAETESDAAAAAEVEAEEEAGPRSEEADAAGAGEPAPAEAPRRGFWQRLFGSDDSGAQPEAPAGEPAGTPAADLAEAPEAPVTEAAEQAPVAETDALAEAALAATAAAVAATAERPTAPALDTCGLDPALAQSMILRLREAEPRLSVWLGIVLEGVDEAGDELWKRLRFLLRSLDAPAAEVDAFVDDFRGWLERMEYVQLDEFRSELQYRLTLALDMEDEEDERSRLFLKISEGLSRTREQFSRRLDNLFSSHGELSESFWEELEELFIMADLGYEPSLELVERLRERARKENVTRVEDVRGLLMAEIDEIFRLPRRISAVNPPEVVLFIGVNGVGKTTTIAKLAHRARMQGKKVMIAAADTFRAAAIEQLQVWAERVGALFHARPAGSDPASVAYEAMDRALAEQVDILFVDTAGRLQTKVNLMEELTKIRQVLGKKHDGAPHRCILVIDATTGQNALSQARLFKEAAGVDELILTKLDGTAKGGVAIAVAMQEKLPITYVGLGEKLEDLRPFNGADYARALLGDLDQGR